MEQENKQQEVKQTQQGEQHEKPMFTQSQLNSIIGDRVNQVKNKYEAKIQELNKQLEEVMNGNDELKKKAEEYDALSEKFEKFKAKYRTEKIQSKFKEKAKEYDVEYVDAALKLVKDELFQLNIDENGDVEGIDDLVKNLVEQNPFLVVQKKQQPKVLGAPTNPSGKAEKTKEQLLKEAHDRAKRTGRQEDIIRYSQLKRELNK